ncbi:MAG: hypothetical protein V7636_361, partial [Actinomycetota bacterium]
MLLDAVEAQHPCPFRYTDRDALRHAAAGVDALAASDTDVLTVELMRMLALLGPRNGHSAIHALDDDPGARRAYPLRLHEFDDGTFVVAAERVELVGSQLIAIDGWAIDDVRNAVTPLVAFDNEWTILARRPSFIVDAVVLRGLGIVERDRAATFRLETPAGASAEIELEPMAVGSYRAGANGADWLPRQPLSVHRRRANDWHWVEPTADGSAVHIGYNVTRGDIT